MRGLTESERKKYEESKDFYDKHGVKFSEYANIVISTKIAWTGMFLETTTRNHGFTRDNFDMKLILNSEWNFVKSLYATCIKVDESRKTITARSNAFRSFRDFKNHMRQSGAFKVDEPSLMETYAFLASHYADTEDEREDLFFGATLAIEKSKLYNHVKGSYNLNADKAYMTLRSMFSRDSDADNAKKFVEKFIESKSKMK